MDTVVVCAPVLMDDISARANLRQQINDGAHETGVCVCVCVVLFC